MSSCYITITGLDHYYGDGFIEPGMMLKLIKDPDNEHDSGAIKVEMDGLGKIGYVANSPYTVQEESFSAGRIYDRIDDETTAAVKYLLPRGILCEVFSLKPIGYDDDKNHDVEK